MNLNVPPNAIWCVLRVEASRNRQVDQIGFFDLIQDTTPGRPEARWAARRLCNVCVSGRSGNWFTSAKLATHGCNVGWLPPPPPKIARAINGLTHMLGRADHALCYPTDLYPQRGEGENEPCLSPESWLSRSQKRWDGAIGRLQDNPFSKSQSRVPWLLSLFCWVLINSLACSCRYGVIRA